MMSLDILFKDIVHNEYNMRSPLSVRGICVDSRTLEKGEIFIAVKGPK